LSEWLGSKGNENDDDDDLLEDCLGLAGRLLSLNRTTKNLCRAKPTSRSSTYISLLILLFFANNILLEQQRRNHPAAFNLSVKGVVHG
jgi:hypothetical protein